MRPQVRFCTSSDGTRLAYTVTGSGPVLVRAPHWFTHIDHDADNPAIRGWVEDLEQRYTLVRFDQRGTGLSDREVREISPEANVRDLEAVVNAAGLERFALLGASQGSAHAIAYTVRNAERVTHLVIYGGFVRGRDLRPGQAEHTAMFQRLIELGWGTEDASFRQVFTTQFMPEATLEQIRAFNALMPLTASATTAAAIQASTARIDLQEQATSVRCPTLVIHALGDVRTPYEEGRLVASLIPGAQLVTLHTRNHLMTQNEPAWQVFLDALAAFYPPHASVAGTQSFPSLTGREAEVLELVAQGLDNLQIAARLDISEKTVRNNVTRIFDKIEVETRSQAIVLARERGLGTSRRD